MNDLATALNATGKADEARTMEERARQLRRRHPGPSRRRRPDPSAVGPAEPVVQRQGPDRVDHR